MIHLFYNTDMCGIYILEDYRCISVPYANGRGVLVEEQQLMSQRREALEIEQSSLISSMKRIGPVGQIDEDFESRKIILLRYPVRKGLSTI